MTVSPIEIRLLSLTCPWAQLVALHRKRVETRSWKTTYRGWVAIHAAKRFPSPAQELANEWDFAPKEMVRGAILCLAWLDSVVGTAACQYDSKGEAPHRGELFSAPHHITIEEERYGDYSRGRFAWFFTSIQALPTPYPYKGAQGLRPVLELDAKKLHSLVFGG